MVFSGVVNLDLSTIEFVLSQLVELIIEANGIMLLSQFDLT